MSTRRSIILFFAATFCLSALAGITATDSRLSEAQLRQLLQARESVWRSCFSNDQKSLKTLLPQGTLGINAGEEEWQDRDAVLAGAREFVRGGGKLVRLEFPRTEHQAFGDVVILYSHYLFETENGGERSVSSGRATEIFVRENGKWINPGWHMDSGD